MSGEKPRRKLRVRRKRSSDDVVETATDPVVMDLGCCLVEAVLSASILAALLIVPARMLVG